MLALTLPDSGAGAATRQQAETGSPSAEGSLDVSTVQGRAEVQGADGSWRLVNGTPYLGEARGLRTGTGRVLLTSRAGGRTLVGSASQLRVYSGETDLQQGQFIIEGPVAAFTLGLHFNVNRGSKVRVDLSPDGSTRRLAVLQGSVRLASGSRIVTVQTGQQVSLPQLQLATYKEEDSWYASVFTGIGEATLEALRGTVQFRRQEGEVQAARAGDPLAEAQSVLTAAQSWAEIGFSGGGYLRLTENSELKVVAIEKTSRGREVVLQLLRGSAWNVVQKGQGGYKITTPVVSTAVRGTRFRVDASGLVKVMEGGVALPSNPGTTLEAGQQKEPGKAPAPLVKDALDLFNEARDAERARPMHLNLLDFRPLQRELALNYNGSNDIRLKASAVDAQGKAWPLKVLNQPGELNRGQYEVSAGQPDFPEGRYQVSVLATRFGAQREWQGWVQIDRTAPALADLKLLRLGRVILLNGAATDLNHPDSPNPPLTLKITGGTLETVVRRVVRGEFRLLLPQPLSQGTLHLELSDQAGNRTDEVIR